MKYHYIEPNGTKHRVTIHNFTASDKVIDLGDLFFTLIFMEDKDLITMSNKLGIKA